GGAGPPAQRTGPVAREVEWQPLQRMATGWPVMVRIFCTTVLSFDVISVMQPRSTFTTSRCSLPLAMAPRSCLHSSQSFLSLPAESAAIIFSLRLETSDCSALTSGGESAVYTIIAPFLSGTTCARAFIASIWRSHSAQSPQAEQSCATLLMWPEHIMPAAAMAFAVLPCGQSLAVAPMAP